MANENKRSTRVAERMKEELALLLLSEVSDPALRGVLVSEVQVTDDCRFGRIYFRFLDGLAPESRRKECQDGFRRAYGFLRRELGTRLQLRVAPELRFLYDEGQDARLRVDALLDEVKRDLKG